MTFGSNLYWSAALADPLAQLVFGTNYLPLNFSAWEDVFGDAGSAVAFLTVIRTSIETAAAAVVPWLGGLAPDVAVQVEAEALYAPYLRRHEAERRLIAREEQLSIPDALDFGAIPGLSREMQQRLAGARPATLGSAGRVPGVTPAAIAALAMHLRRAAPG
jgi:tRNA U34 5-carboxymethylaminomethyl modifying enzyme MnmG/GidA